jgi:hypothetical protein
MFQDRESSECGRNVWNKTFWQKSWKNNPNGETVRQKRKIRGEDCENSNPTIGKVIRHNPRSEQGKKYYDPKMFPTYETQKFWHLPVLCFFIFFPRQVLKFYALLLFKTVQCLKIREVLGFTLHTVNFTKDLHLWVKFPYMYIRHKRNRKYRERVMRWNFWSRFSNMNPWGRLFQESANVLQ